MGKLKTSGKATKSVTVRMDLELNDGLDNYCADTRFSKSLLVNAAIKSFLGLADEAKFEAVKSYVILNGGKRKRDSDNDNKE